MRKTIEDRLFEATRVRLASRLRYRNLQHGIAQDAQNPNTQQTDLFLKAAQCFRNMVRNMDTDVLDKGFFRIISDNLPHDKGVALMQMAFTYEEIFNMYSSRARRTRLRFSKDLDSILTAIWNNCTHRETCRIVVDVMADYIEAFHKLQVGAISV